LQKVRLGFGIFIVWAGDILQRWYGESSTQKVLCEVLYRQTNHTEIWLFSLFTKSRMCQEWC